jgi:ornithine cyclodeaminase/alanine dehydrogenase-like protein (mu-crystallin family)
MGANAPTRHEVSAELIRQMNLVVTDDLATAQTGSGDLIDAARAGVIRWEDVVSLEKIVAGGPPRPRPQRILFQSNGIADEDLAVGRYVLEQVKRKKTRVKNISEI